jgi:hypothetical protein
VGRIEKVSSRVAWVAGLLRYIIPLAAVLWIVTLYAFFMPLSESAAKGQLGIAVALALLHSLLWWQIARVALHLCTEYQTGSYFTEEVVRRLGSLGRFGLLAAVVPTFSLRSGGVPPDVSAWVDIDGSVRVGGIMVAFVLIFVSWIVEEARKLKAEQDLVV